MRLNIKEILKDLKNYRPRRRGWTWRKKAANQKMGAFTFREITEPLKESVPLITAHNFDNIDPQPEPVITTEIASGRFEDDIRRMRMAAHHGADHIMVIRTAGQSHFDGLIEGSPQGVGGIPVTRKQVRAQRKALDIVLRVLVNAVYAFLGEHHRDVRAGNARYIGVVVNRSADFVLDHVKGFALGADLLSCYRDTAYALG